MYYFGRGFYEIIASEKSPKLMLYMQIDIELKEVLEVIYKDGNILFIYLFLSMVQESFSSDKL